MFFFFKQKTAYEMRISDWSSDVCSSDLRRRRRSARSVRARRRVPGRRSFPSRPAGRAVRDPRLARLGAFPGDIGEEHAIPRLRGYLRDARAHLPRPDHADCLHLACSFDENVPCRTRSRVYSAYVEAAPARSPTPPPKSLCRSEEHTSELQSLMRISYAVFCLKKKNKNNIDKYTRVQSLSNTQHTE